VSGRDKNKKKYGVTISKMTFHLQTRKRLSIFALHS